MPADDEARLLADLTIFVEAWIAADGMDRSASPSEPAHSSRDADGHASDALTSMSGETFFALVAMGYLERREGAGFPILVPTTEALCLTDPWLCEELASSLKSAFHERFLRHHAGFALPA
ncbi:MAG: hypothetical protein QM589_00475 [Thermomicrobiales bacterium]